MFTVTEQNASVGKQWSELDVLFLYRTAKKKRYFTSLSEHALTSLNCEVQSYHALPSVSPVVLNIQQLNEIVFKAELELYHAKDEAWQTVKVFLRPILVAQTDLDYSCKIVGRKYKKKKPKELKNAKFSLPDNYLLVPFQKDRDSQILDNSTWIKSMNQMFVVLVNALELSDRDDLHLVFREHPSAKTKYSALHKLAAKHPRICFDQQSDLSDIITQAEAVVTVNSSVGLESLLLNTKVITLGDAFYNIDPLVLTAAATSELATQINRLSRFTLDQQLLQKFVGYLEHEYVVPGDWKKPDKLHFQHIEQRFLK